MHERVGAREAHRLDPEVASAQFLVGLAILAIVTAACFTLGFGAMPTALIHLLAIVVLSLRVGFLPLAALSVSAVASIDYFFIPPGRHWHLGGPVDALELCVFVVTALVITPRGAGMSAREALGRHPPRPC